MNAQIRVLMHMILTIKLFRIGKGDIQPLVEQILGSKYEEKETSEKVEEPWTKSELLEYLEDATPYQRVLLAALVQVDIEPAPIRRMFYNE